MIYYMISKEYPYNMNYESIDIFINFMNLTEIKFSSKFCGKDLAKDLIKRCLVKNAKNRIKIDEVLNHHEAKELGLPAEADVIVISVERDSPAGRAGLGAGDAIVRFNDTAIANADDLVALVSATAPGTRVTVKTLRDGSRPGSCSQVEHCRKKLSRACRAGEIQRNRATIRFDGDGKAKKPAALAFGVDRSCNHREHVTFCRKPETVAVRQFAPLVGPMQEHVQQILFPRLQCGRA